MPPDSTRVRSLPAVPATTHDPLGRRRRRHRNAVVLVVLGTVLATSAVLGVAIGPVWVAPADVLRILSGNVFGGTPGGTDATAQAIVWDVRLPRVVLGIAVGAGLAVCGAALQAMVRNVLADPYLLGINSGASSGAAVTILFGVTLGLGEHALAGSAFLGALSASLLVFVVARTAGRITSVRLLLTGVAVGYALSALTSFLVFASGSAEGARSVMFWLLGSLALAQWGGPLVALVAVVVLTVSVLALWARRLDALAIGDETALVLGRLPDPLPHPASRRGLVVHRSDRRGVGLHRVRRTRRPPPRPPPRRVGARVGRAGLRAARRGVPPVGGPAVTDGPSATRAPDRHHRGARRGTVPPRPHPPHAPVGLTSRTKEHHELPHPPRHRGRRAAGLCPHRVRGRRCERRPGGRCSDPAFRTPSRTAGPR